MNPQVLEDHVKEQEKLIRRMAANMESMKRQTVSSAQSFSEITLSHSRSSPLPVATAQTCFAFAAASAATEKSSQSCWRRSLQDLAGAPPPKNPTDGFTNIPLTESNFKLQKPYDIPLEQRCSFQNGVHRLWVNADDKPYNPSSPTQPRTEIRILGLDYSSGVWQFEGYGFVPNSTSGTTIVQIHGATNYTTTIKLRIYNGDMSFSNSKGTKSICIKGKFTNTKGNFSNKSNFNIRGNNSSRNKDNTNINECNNNNNNKGSIVTNISSIKGSNINTNNSLIYMEKEECCELVLTSECICLLRRRTQSRGVVYFDYQTLLTMWHALSM
ncbi:putative uncharacterized protein DDB_G0277255 [Camellia sinensis]|uniref:putative uncharacterized protein DDB_G0277255 n=1 Tax=Camellia sinensis TaxID=4442 RepID=UPI0010368F26|nr:putative uncharacterized protein DDB_G0277255 [Camellia sinensis]